jgi:glycosyltransferase involved in cell wall biosynthesis
MCTSEHGSGERCTDFCFIRVIYNLQCSDRFLFRRNSLILILFPSFYPYDYAAEYTFIQPEIHGLLEKFEKVILVPRIAKGKKLPLPSGVEVDDSYAELLKRISQPLKMMRMAFSFQCFFREIHERPAILLYPSKIAKLVLFSGRAETARRWAIDFIRGRHIDPSRCIFYSYWFDHTATGLTLVKREFPAAKVVSRAHGYDIYEKYYYPYYWPCRPETLEALDRLFFASEAGRGYFSEHYPAYISKFETAHLGTKDPSVLASSSSDGVFRIVSCSYIVPVKRLDLLLEGIAAAARLRPEQKFEWFHFGDGARKEALVRKLARKFPANVQGRFLGNVPNHEILQFYKDHPVDVFVNVSSTEGGAPVAIQEAISYGIPIIATSVGGNPEIVFNRNGILLEENPTPAQVAAALLRIWDNPLATAEMRIESRRIWQTSYNAEVNSRTFAGRLRSVGES